MKIKPGILAILNESKLEDNILFLPKRELDRNTYLEVNKVLELLGGKWNRKAKGHIFSEDVEEMLNDVINYGEVTDHKKEYQFFPTPPEIVKQMIELAEIKKYDIVLEPSAGEGAIAYEIRKITDLVCVVELNPKMYEKIANDFWGHWNEDFLKFFSTGGYDKVVMNPPFSKQHDIDHIMRAFELLNKRCLGLDGDIIYEGGILVSVVSESAFFRSNKKSQDFRDWLQMNNAEIIDLEPGAFKSSGTMVKTRIIKIVKR
jgi:predicted RNA methylase